MDMDAFYKVFKPKLWEKFWCVASVKVIVKRINTKKKSQPLRHNQIFWYSKQPHTHNQNEFTPIWLTFSGEDY